MSQGEDSVPVLPDYGELGPNGVFVPGGRHSVPNTIDAQAASLKSVRRLKRRVVIVAALAAVLAAVVLMEGIMLAVQTGDMWSFETNISYRVAELEKREKKLFFQLEGISDNGYCETSGGRKFQFNASIDPDSVYESKVSNKGPVRVPVTGYYTIDFRGFSSGNKSCDVDLEVGNHDNVFEDVGATDWENCTMAKKTFKCSPNEPATETHFKGLVSWSTSLCLTANQELNFKSKATSTVGAFKCTEGQRLTILGRLEKEEDICPSCREGRTNKEVQTTNREPRKEKNNEEERPKNRKKLLDKYSHHN